MRRPPLRIRRFGQAQDGAAAVEFALVLPTFMVLAAGALGAGMLGLSVNGLTYAVQEAARCAAVQTLVCASPGATTAFAQARYDGPAISPVFTYSLAACGHRVVATGVYDFPLAFTTLQAPVSVSACYPRLQPA